MRKTIAIIGIWLLIAALGFASQAYADELRLLAITEDYTNVLSYDGTAWETLGQPGIGYVTNAVASSDNIVYAGSDNEPNEPTIARFDDPSWVDVDPQPAPNFDYIKSMTRDTSGNIYVAGVAASPDSGWRVQKYNGVGWTNLQEEGVTLSNVHAMKWDDASGLLYVSNGSSVSYWDGDDWGTDMPSAGLGDVYSLSVVNDVYIAGNDGTDAHVKVYDKVNTVWNSIGDADLAAYNNARFIAIDLAGNMVVAVGDNPLDVNDPTTILRWDGSNWVNWDTAGITNIRSLFIDSNENFIVAGIDAAGDNSVAYRKWGDSEWAYLSTVPDDAVYGDFYLNGMADANAPVGAGAGGATPEPATIAGMLGTIIICGIRKLRSRKQVS